MENVTVIGKLLILLNRNAIRYALTHCIDVGRAHYDDKNSISTEAILKNKKGEDSGLKN